VKYYEILEGAIDLHMHTGPSRLPCRMDFLDAAREAEATGMRAIVYKPFYFTTMDRAFIAEKSVVKLKVFGGIVLDYGMGGLNPTVVKNAIDEGAKFVWMPLFDSKHTLQSLSKNSLYSDMVSSTKGLEILTPEEEIIPEVREILEIISKTPHVILETSHLSPKESIKLAAEAKRLGCKNVLVTHPLSSVIGATQEEIREMAGLGAIINHCVAPCYPNPLRDGLNPKVIADSIKDIGAKYCVLSSDSGNIHGPSPVEGLRAFCEMMKTAGVSKKEIEIMIKENPTDILGLS